MRMYETFAKYWQHGEPERGTSAKCVAFAAWNAATRTERERCAKIVENECGCPQADDVERMIREPE